MIRIDQLFSVVLFEFLKINTSVIHSNFCESSFTSYAQPVIDNCENGIIISDVIFIVIILS